VIEPKILFITTFWPNKAGHHASFSGYHRLVKYVRAPSKLLIHPNKTDPITWAINKVPLLMRRVIKGSFYSITSLSYELKSVFQETEIIHHLYGEDTVLISPFIKRIFDKKVIATFHQPPKIFKSIMPYYWEKILQHLDHIIVVSRIQQEFLVKVLGEESKISFIPHGVEFELFNTSTYERYNCLMVGRWLRDFDVALKAMTMIRKKGIRLIFDIVLPRGTPEHIVWKIRVASPPGTHIHYDISDEALLKLYAESRMFLMPLLDFTASNSLLEAMASGLPIVVTDVGGVRDYVDEKCGILVKKSDPNSIAEAIEYLSEDEEIVRKLGQNCRMKASSLSWKVLGPLYEDLFVKTSY
jgi:glycosyltransferase involved in cell wall biosynthesis